MAFTGRRIGVGGDDDHVAGEPESVLELERVRSDVQDPVLDELPDELGPEHLDQRSSIDRAAGCKNNEYLIVWKRTIGRAQPGPEHGGRGSRAFWFVG